MKPAVKHGCGNWRQNCFSLSRSRVCSLLYAEMLTCQSRSGTTASPSMKWKTYSILGSFVGRTVADAGGYLACQRPSLFISPDRITTGMFPIAAPGAIAVRSPIVSPMPLPRDYHRKRCLRVHCYCERSRLPACSEPDRLHLPVWHKRFHARAAYIGYHGSCLLRPPGSIRRTLFRGDFASHPSRVRPIYM